MWPLSAIKLKSATGLVVEDDHVVIVRVASTGAGPRVVKTTFEELGERDVRETLRELHAAKTFKGTVVVGIDARKAYFGTKKTHGEAGEEGEALPQFLTAGSRWAVHQVTLKQRKQAFLATSACEREFARDVLGGLSKVKPNLLRMEPAPLALNAYAAAQARGPRKWRTVVRVLLDGSHGLAILAHGKLALAWRPFQFESGEEAAEMASVIRGLRAFARSELDLGIDGVLVHVGEHDEKLTEDCEEHCGIQTEVLPRVGLDAETVAAGLGMAGLNAKSQSPDLLTKLKPPPTLRDVFPYGVAAMLLMVVLGSGYLLSEEADGVERRIRGTDRQSRKDAKAAKVKRAHLKKRHKELALENDMVYGFIQERVFWAPIFRDLSTRLPDTTMLFGLRGRDSFSMPSTTKTKIKVKATKEILLQGTVRIPKGQAAPEEVTALLESLAKSEAITRVFPRVDGANVMRKPGPDKDIVTFFAKCSLPRW